MKTTQQRRVRPKLKLFRYSSNNSGGRWWLKDKDWKALERNGWKVEWAKKGGFMVQNGRYLGALATSAKKKFYSEGEAVAEWERITGQSADDQGCPCCGQPHNFYEP